MASTLAAPLSFALVGVVTILACASGGDARKGDSVVISRLPVHEHTAPHHGTLVELGEEYAHLELVLDSAAGTLTAYALDGEAEQPVRLAQRHLMLRTLIGSDSHDSTDLLLLAVPNALTGETVGATSKFAATSSALKGQDALAGRVDSVTSRGHTFTDVSFRTMRSTPHSSRSPFELRR